MILPHPLPLLRPLALIAVCAASPFLCHAPAQALEFTLESAFDTAEAANYAARLSRETVAQAEENSRLQRAELLPSLALELSQRRGRSVSVGANVVRPGVTERFDSVLSGRLDLLDPRRIAGQIAARIGIDVAELDSAGVRQSVLAAVGGAYFAHRRNLRRVEVIDSNIERARVLLDLSRNQLDAGVATQIDVTRAEAQLATVEQSRLQQQTVVQEGELRFKQLLALDLTRPLRLEEFHLGRVEAGMETAALAEAAFGRRADLRQAERLLEQLDMEARAARLDRLPSLALTGAYGTATETAFDGNEARTWSAVAALSFPVFDGRRIRALHGLALSRQRAQELRVRELKQQIQIEVRLAAQDAASRLAQIEVAGKSHALAAEELRLARLRYGQGVADNREVVEAQNRLAVAEDNLVEAVYQYNLSRLELARARGDVRLILAEKAE